MGSGFEILPWGIRIGWLGEGLVLWIFLLNKRKPALFGRAGWLRGFPFSGFCVWVPVAFLGG